MLLMELQKILSFPICLKYENNSQMISDENMLDYDLSRYRVIRVSSEKDMITVEIKRCHCETHENYYFEAGM